MSQKIPRLAFDIDGVLARFMQAFMVLFNGKFLTNLHPSQVTEYHPIGDGKLFSKGQWDSGFELMKQTPFFWATLKPFDPELFADINVDMMNFTFNGYFVTRRASMEAGDIRDANTLTRIWLENVGLQAYTSVIAMEHTPRVDILKAMEVDAYIDDWGEQFQECREAGIRAYLMDRPWNQHIDTPYRVFNIRQFVDRALGRSVDVTSILRTDPISETPNYRLGRIAASKGAN